MAFRTTIILALLLAVPAMPARAQFTVLDSAQDGGQAALQQRHDDTEAQVQRADACEHAPPAHTRVQTDAHHLTFSVASKVRLCP